MENADKGRYHCKFSGCDKSFQRREHLARHAKTHTRSRYVCKVCQREFTRSDSLQRHLALHGDEFKPAPSGRSKHACVTCHASKIKCDGNQPCSRCHKKEIDCKYDQLDVDTQHSVSQTGTPALADDPLASNMPPSAHASSSLIHATAATINGSNFGESEASFSERLLAAFRKSNGPIDWSATRIQSDLPADTALDASSKATHSEMDDWPPLPLVEVKKYSDLYFTHFHHRWPILHAPAFKNDISHPVLLSCVAMIGACIDGSSDSKELAMNLQTRVIDWILPRLCQLSSEDSIDHSSTLSVCEASLLYIVFGFYCGKEIFLSKAILVRGMLVAALRELSFFRPETPAPYEKPGYFVPLRLVKEGGKQRLSTCLFKIDSYLNILRGDPEVLRPEELHFTLPSTFALWNADGLNIFEIRHLIEPESRNQTTVCRIICEPALESFTVTDGLMLVEDVQLGICAMHAKLWLLLERMRNNPEDEVSNAIKRHSLKRRLEAWKYLLLQIPIHETDHVNFTQEQHLAMRYYYGIEDHSQPGWQLIVIDRPKNLLFDTLMLYHLLNLHLYADIRTLTQLAKDKIQVEPLSIWGEKFLKTSERREDLTRVWAESASVRRALCHATDILLYNNFSGLENIQIDPIAYVALSVAALVVWGYCMFGGKGCPDCISEDQILPFIGAPVIELTKWSGPRSSQTCEKDKETWIEMGGCRGALMGLLFCRCNVDLLVAKFRTCIRDGWNVADTIAPGIFRS